MTSQHPACPPGKTLRKLDETPLRGCQDTSWRFARFGFMPYQASLKQIIIDNLFLPCQTLLIFFCRKLWAVTRQASPAVRYSLLVTPGAGLPKGRLADGQVSSGAMGLTISHGQSYSAPDIQVFARRRGSTGGLARCLPFLTSRE
jgi:hypothetical protein